MKGGIEQMSNKNIKIGLFSLIALVISSSVGSGIFGLSKDLATSASPGGALIGWVVVGVGVLMLALSFNNLSLKKPEINSGVQGYAEEGFGKLGGFISGWGYWLSAWLGNVAFATMLMSTVGYFFPVFKDGQNMASIIVVSIILWLLAIVVNRGVESAVIINAIVTVCKLIPLFVFILITLFAFKFNVFTSDFWGNVVTNVTTGETSFGSLVVQTKSSMITLMWAFVGIEGAAILSTRARKKSDVGKATVIGVVGLLIIYILGSILPYGIMTAGELAALDQPAMAYVLEEIVGSWGAAFINIGVIVSILGAWLSWTMLPAETGMLMAQDGLLPKVWGRVNKKGSPTYALLTTTVLSQIFIFTFLFTEYAYAFAFSLCTSAILISYLFVGAYQVKYTLSNMREKDANKQLVIGLIAVVFQLWAIYAAGLSYMLLTLTSYLPGIILYLRARRENKVTALNFNEKIVTFAITAGAIIAIVLLIIGKVEI